MTRYSTRKLLPFMILFSLVLSLCACSSNSAQPDVRNTMSIKEDTVDRPAQMATSDVAETADEAVDDLTAPDQYLIKTYNMYLTTKNSEEAFEQAQSIIKKYEGFIERLDKSDSSLKYINFEAKIPVEDIDEAVKELEKLGELEDFSILAENATTRMTDIEARLSIKQQQLKKMQELLEQEQSMENVIELNKTIIELQTEIEVAQQRQRDLTQEVEYATLNLDISLSDKDVVDKPNDMISPNSFMDKLALAFVNSVINLVNTISAVLIWFVAHILELILLALIIFGVVKLAKRFNKKNNKQDDK